MRPTYSSDQLRVHLLRLAVLLEPHADRIERRFMSRLRALDFEPKHRLALAALRREPRRVFWRAARRR